MASKKNSERYTLERVRGGTTSAALFYSTPHGTLLFGDWGFPEFDRIVLDAALLLRKKDSSINKSIVPPFRFFFFFFFFLNL